MRSLLAAAGVLTFVASVAEAQQVRFLDIPAGNLQQAVIALGRQARISIALTDTSLALVKVARMRGRMTAEQALQRLLAETPATYVTLGGSGYRVVRSAVRPTRMRSDLADREPQTSDMADIVVTASKRGVLMRDYPGPAIVVDGDTLAAGSAADGTAAIRDRIPSLGSTHLGPGRDKLFVRAIADSSFSGQSQATVGQYFGEGRLNDNAPDPDLRLYDVGSVELLPGPQGTLYGAGSMGGVLRIVPNAPDTGGARGSVIASAATTAHGDASWELAGMFNLPLAGDRAAIRMVGYDIRDGGYIDDIGREKKDVNRASIRGGRAAGLVELGSNWSLEAGGLLQKIEGRDSQYAVRGLPDLTRRTALAQPFSNEFSFGHVTLRGTAEKILITATVNAAHEELVENFAISGDEKAARLFQQSNRSTLLSSEVRFSRTRDDGSGWLLGTHVLRNRSNLDRQAGPPGKLESLSGVRNSIDEQTVFGEYTHNPTSFLSLTGGARLTHVSFHGEAKGSIERPLAGEPSAGGSEWRLLPSAAVAIEPRTDTSLYLRYQEGFRPAGLIVRSDATQKLASDHIAAWEAGMRFGQSRNARLSGALSLSYSRWTDIQADTIDTVGLPSTTNIGDGNIWTVDGRLGWRAHPSLNVSLIGTWNRSRVTNPNPGIIIVAGAPLPNVPDAAARVGIDYVRSAGIGELHLSGWVRYVGKSSLGIGPILGRRQGDFVDTGLEARIRRGRSFLFVRGTNLLDTVGNRFALGSVFTIDAEDQITPLRPRTIRIGIIAGF